MRPLRSLDAGWAHVHAHNLRSAGAEEKLRELSASAAANLQHTSVRGELQRSDDASEVRSVRSTSGRSTSHSSLARSDVSGEPEQVEAAAAAQQLQQRVPGGRCALRGLKAVAP
jgi:hypothetical protein